MDNWPPAPSNPSSPPRVSRPPPGFPNPPPGFEPLPSTQPLFVNINNNTPLLHNNAPPLENIHHPPPNLGNQDFSNPSNIMDFVHPKLYALPPQHVLSMLCNHKHNPNASKPGQLQFLNTFQTPLGSAITPHLLLSALAA
ncbi:hypothetical protein Tco_0682813 [Tanacetum coccineum]|uniref:Uncharacterized protein n=1 Tax=Tanacetum coccineum TaxID=301880 RepID=A0ABQ4XS89_9ASTR